MMKYIFTAMILAYLCIPGSDAAQAQSCMYLNTAGGDGALASDTTGCPNTAFGYAALFNNTTGYANSAFGFNALADNVIGTENTAVGNDALASNTGNNNTAIGNAALINNNSGDANTAIGDVALYYNTTGIQNIATGTASLYTNTTDSNNVATGFNALNGNTTGSSNVATGNTALEYNTTGIQNTAIGYEALYENTTGNYNVALGYGAGGQNSGGASFNIDIDSPGQNTDSGVTRIGHYQTSFFAAGIDGVSVSSGVEVFINSSGQLGTVNSSIRFKEDVNDMAEASSKLFQLRPVTYRYKQAYADGSKPLDYGLIAEEVAQVYPDLVARDGSGAIQTVQYQKLTPMLLNEVQKQQHQLESQQRTIEILEQRLSALETATPSANSKTHATAE